MPIYGSGPSWGANGKPWWEQNFWKNSYQNYKAGLRPDDMALRDPFFMSRMAQFGRIQKYGPMGAIQNQTLKGLLTGVKPFVAPNSANDIRNSTLALATAAQPGWNDFMRGTQLSGAMSGMEDSGFYHDTIQRAQAAQQAQVTAQQAALANQMYATNDDAERSWWELNYGQNSPLAAWLKGRRNRYLKALSLANGFGG